MTKQRFHIMLVDDYRDDLETFSDLLHCWGYDVTPVTKGREAIQLLSRGRYDLLITNLTELPRIDVLGSVRENIPDMTNMDVLKTVRRKNKVLPVIVFAPYGSDESASKATRLGAADYIRKPFSLEELKSRIESVLQEREGSLPQADTGSCVRRRRISNHGSLYVHKWAVRDQTWQDEGDGGER